MVNKEQTVKRIADLVKEKRIAGISDVRDETSDEDGVRIVIEIKRGFMGNVILNQLYAHTPLESSYGSIMLVVDHNRPRVMNLVQVLEAYLEHRMEVLIRKSKFELKKAEARAHILAGLRLALDNIDEVVRIIRESRDKVIAGETLMERFGFSKIQANAILEMRLHQLTGLSREEIQAEYDALMKQIAYLNELLQSKEMRLGVIRADLLEVRDKYADPRRSEITLSETDLNYADLIPRHSCVITVSNTGYIKRVPADTYKTQHRGGKGIISMETKEDDYVEHLFNADSHDLIFFFTDKGFMYWLNVYEIPEGARTGKGRAIVNMIKVAPGEKICAMLTVKKEEFEDENKFIVMASRAGYIKKTALSQFKNLRKAGLRALVIEENDDLIGAAISSNGDEIILSTKLGMACRFDQIDDQIRPMGRTARGVTGMRFKLDGDEVVAMEVIHEHVEEFDDELENDENTEVVDSETEDMAVAGNGPEVLVVTDGGMGKRSLVATYRKTNRGAKGVVSIRLKDGENVVTLLQIAENDEVLLTTEKGQLVRIRAAEIRRVGRASKGVKIMNLNSGDRITGVTRFKEVEVDENDSQENGNPQEIVIASIENPAAQQVEEMTSGDNVVEETDSETQE
jgi:DNA gyrase subunit A